MADEVTLSVNGTDLAGYGFHADPSGLFGGLGKKGSNLDGQRPGETYMPKFTAAGTRTTQFVVTSMTDVEWTPGQLLSKLRDLTGLLNSSDGPITLTRTAAYDDGTVSAAASAEWVDSQPTIVSPGTARWALDFKLLEGGFYTAQQSTTVLSGAGGTVHNGGQDRTRKVTLTFSGGGPYVLTNSTTGRVLHVPTGSVSVDVWAGTVTSGGSSVLASTTWSGDAAEPFLLALAKGDNTVSLTGGGQVVVAWQPVYL